MITGFLFRIGWLVADLLLFVGAAVVGYYAVKHALNKLFGKKP